MTRECAISTKFYERVFCTKTNRATINHERFEPLEMLFGSYGDAM